MRANAFAARLVEMDDERAACFLAGICRGAKVKAACVLVYSALVDCRTQKDGLDPGRVQGIRRAARTLGLTEVLSLLDDGGSAPMAQAEEVPATLPVFKGVALGSRRALARRPSIHWLERLLHDPDTGVIGNLLANPRITEREVLKIASKTPITPEILVEVARSSRWISRYRVKMALVLNPLTPLSVSLPLLGFLLAQDLREIVEYPGLPNELRVRAGALFMRDTGGFASRRSMTCSPKGP